MDHTAIEPLNPVFFQLGPIAVQWYAIFVLSGFGAGVGLAVREVKKKGFDKDLFLELAPAGFLLAIIGTRLYYVIFNLDVYWRSPGRIFSIWEGGLAIHGGVIAAFLYVHWQVKKRSLPFLPVLDIVSVSFFIGQIIGRFGNFMNQEAYGRVIAGASLDAQRSFLESLLMPRWMVDNMLINGYYHHPTFLYEALWNLVGLLLAIFVIRKMSQILVGEVAAFYAIWYSAGRFMIEFLRTDSLMMGPLMSAQVISVLTMIVVPFFVIKRRMNKVNMIPYHTFHLADVQSNRKNKKRVVK